MLFHLTKILEQPLNINFSTKVVLSVMHILSGICTFCGTVGLLILANIFDFGIDGIRIWSSITFSITGGLILCIRNNSRICVISGIFVLSIFSTCFAGIISVQSCLSLVLDFQDYQSLQLYLLAMLLFSGILELLNGIISTTLMFNVVYQNTSKGVTDYLYGDRHEIIN